MKILVVEDEAAIRHTPRGAAVQATLAQRDDGGCTLRMTHPGSIRVESTDGEIRFVIEWQAPPASAGATAPSAATA